ncbi:MAG TPA: response regulator transcription factor [Nitrospiria bacterium]|nr:response regulator transcription factor [Nitrospiria bacterium]
MPKKVLIIEDDPDTSSLVAHYLKQEGYSVGTASDGVMGLKQVRKNSPDLLILDIILPHMDGFEVCKKLRQDAATSRLPILMLTALGEESDKVVGLELGTDDYVTKPFSPKELVARVKGLLRRYEHREIGTLSSFHKYGPLILDEARQSVKVNGQGVRLTAKEFALLAQLLKRKGRVLTRQMLLETVWGYESQVTTRTIEVHIYGLRQKIPFLTKAIQTVVSSGYKLLDEGNQGTV